MRRRVRAVWERRWFTISASLFVNLLFRTSLAPPSSLAGARVYIQRCHVAPDPNLAPPLPATQDMASLVLCDGYHRAEAFLCLLRQHYKPSSGAGTPPDRAAAGIFSVQDIAIDVLFLGPHSDDAFLNAALALNHGNDATSPTTFMDNLAVVCHLM